jgi:plastocyanin
VVAGTVTGRVVFRGEPPPLPSLRVTVDRDVCGDAIPSEALVVSPRGGVKWAVAYLEGVKAEAPAGELAEVKLTNRRCRFVPHVLAARVGAELAVVNDDPVLHNLRARIPGPREVMNVVQPTQGQVSRRTIKRDGVMYLHCDAHTVMQGWMLAFDHPYFAVTDDEGRFTINAVPPGTYRLAVWHEGWASTRTDERGLPIYADPTVLTQQVVVPAQGSATTTFELGGQ